MKTAMQQLIERLESVKPTQYCSLETIKGWAGELLEVERQQIVLTYSDPPVMAIDFTKIEESQNSSNVGNITALLVSTMGSI